MAGVAVTVSSPSTGEPWGSLAIGALVATGTIVPVVLGPVIASGDNALTVPASATGMVFVPPSTNSHALTYKGVSSGNTGTSMPQTSFFVTLFDPTNPPGTVYVNAAGTVGLSQVVFW
jgi:hypothetical protein